MYLVGRRFVAGSCKWKPELENEPVNKHNRDYISDIFCTYLVQNFGTHLKARAWTSWTVPFRQLVEWGTTSWVRYLTSAGRCVRSSKYRGTQWLLVRLKLRLSPIGFPIYTSSYSFITIIIPILIPYHGERHNSFTFISYIPSTTFLLVTHHLSTYQVGGPV